MTKLSFSGRTLFLSADPSKVQAQLDGRQPGDLDPMSVSALEHAPRAAAWARGFAGRFNSSADEFHRFAAPHIARMAVESIADASVRDTDDRLYDLLAGVIDECAAVSASVPEAPDTPSVTETPATGRPDASRTSTESIGQSASGAHSRARPRKSA